MINILLKDFNNKLMQEMCHLREETELLICENINFLNKNGYDLNIETLSGKETEYWRERGFSVDNSLYDKLILEYNQKENVELLTRWK